MATPKASVIVPMYNASHYVLEQLEALASQSVPPDEYEVIWVDNGSTDATATMIGASIRHRPNMRLATAPEVPTSYFARNIGAAHARGDVYLFCDADDVVNHHWVASMTAALRQPISSAARSVNSPFNDPRVRTSGPSRSQFATTFFRLPSRRTSESLLPSSKRLAGSTTSSPAAATSISAGEPNSPGSGWASARTGSRLPQSAVPLGETKPPILLRPLVRGVGRTIRALRRGIPKGDTDAAATGEQRRVGDRATAPQFPRTPVLRELGVLWSAFPSDSPSLTHSLAGPPVRPPSLE